MEPNNTILTPIHEDFFGNLVGSQSPTVKTTPSGDYVTDWSMPS